MKSFLLKMNVIILCIVPLASGIDLNKPFHISLGSFGGFSRLQELNLNAPSTSSNQTAIPRVVTSESRAYPTSKISLDALEGRSLQEINLNAPSTSLNQPAMPRVVASESSIHQISKISLDAFEGRSLQELNLNLNNLLEIYVKSNKPECVAKALSQGANIETCGFAGGSPLTWAAERNFIEIATLLLGQGANPNASDFEWTALMLAASKGYLPMCELLLNNGAQVNLNDVYGRTPLNVAAANGHLNVIKLLVARGANKSYKTWDKKTALDLAIQKKHDEIAAYLQ